MRRLRSGDLKSIRKEVCSEMKFTLVKGVPERLEEYREVFYGSKLYDAYFAEGTA